MKRQKLISAVMIYISVQTLIESLQKLLFVNMHKNQNNVLKIHFLLYQPHPGLITAKQVHLNKTCLKKCSRVKDLKSQHIIPQSKETQEELRNKDMTSIGLESFTQILFSHRASFGIYIFSP